MVTPGTEAIAAAAPARRAPAVAGERPEHTLLLACARTAVSPDVAWSIAQCVAVPLDWNYLRRLARRHGLIALLAHHVGEHGSAVVPPRELALLQEAYLATARRNLCMTAHLAGLLQAFAAQGLPVLAYKGPVTAADAYGNLALRRFSDLDLLVRPRAFARAERMLTSGGYRLRESRGHESSFDHPTGDVRVDLHRSLTPARWPSGLAFERLWSEARRVSCGGIDVPTLGPAHTLLGQCLEVAKDAWTERNKLIKLADIAEHLARHPDDDAGALLAEATRTGLRRVALFGLGLARDVLGARLPTPLAQAVDGEDLGGWPARVRRRLFATAERGTRIHGPSLYAALRERRRDRLRMRIWVSYRILRNRLRLG